MARESITEAYIEGWRRRAASRQLEQEARQRSAHELATRLAERLMSQEGASGVWLFGSAAAPGRFRLDSDLDLAVAGIPAERFFGLWAELERLCDLELDLVRLEWAPESLRQHVRCKGTLLPRGGETE